METVRTSLISSDNPLTVNTNPVEEPNPILDGWLFSGFSDKLMDKMKIGIIVSSAVFFSTGAFADQLCKKVDIKVKNMYPERIKVTRINYRDKEDKRWRDNDLKNTEISNGSTRTITESLEYVGNENIPKMQVEFQYETGHSWSNKVWSNVTTGLGGTECVKSKDYNITVSSTDSKK